MNESIDIDPSIDLSKTFHLQEMAKGLIIIIIIIIINKRRRCCNDSRCSTASASAVLRDKDVVYDPAAAR